MRILHIHRYLGAGGIEAMVCGLVNEMAKTQDVSVCTIMRPLKGDVFYNKLSPEVKKLTLDKHDGRPPFKEMFKLVRLIRKGGYDVVHIHGFFYYYAVAILLLHNRTRFFYTIHSDALKENTSWDLKLLSIKKLYFKKGWVRPVTISPVSAESFSALYGCDSRMIMNGIPNPSISDVSGIAGLVKNTPRTKVFLCAGRISTEKNHVLLCEVFSRLIEEGRDVALIIAGPNHNEQIMSIIESFSSDRIRYVGESSEIPSIMSSVDALCIPSAYEGLPIVLLEALAVGCVPICTPVGGIVNVVEDGINGLLSSSVDEPAYYDAVSRFLNMTEDELILMKKRCMDSFLPYDIGVTAGKYMDYYSEVSINDNKGKTA